MKRRKGDRTFELFWIEVYWRNKGGGWGIRICMSFFENQGCLLSHPRSPFYRVFFIEWQRHLPLNYLPVATYFTLSAKWDIVKYLPWDKIEEFSRKMTEDPAAWEGEVVSTKSGINCCWDSSWPPWVNKMIWVDINFVFKCLATDTQ